METTLKAKGLCRPLGPLEQNLTSRKLNGFYNNFCLIATYNLDLTDSVIFSGLRKLILKHSLLVTNYSSARNEIHPVKRLLLGDIVKFEHRENPLNNDDLVEEIENCKFEIDSDKPIFKILLINRRTMAVIFEHAYTDGGSAVNFHKNFLKLVNSLTVEEANVSVDENSVLFDLETDIDRLNKLPPPTEESIESKPDYLFKLRGLVKSYLPSLFKDYVNDHNYNQVPTVDIKGLTVTKWPGVKATLTHKTLFKVLNFTSKQSKDLIKFARSKEMSITPILQTLFLKLLISAKVIQNDDENCSYYLNSMIPLDLRRFVPDELKEICELGARVFPGIFINTPINDIEASLSDDSLFWKMCGQNFEKIKFNANDNKVLMVQYNSNIINYDSKSPDKMKKASYDNFLKSRSVNTRFSNLGLFKDPKTPGRYVVEDMVFSQSIGVNGGEFVINMISTERGGMNICVTCLSEMFDEKEKFNDFCDLFKKEILKFI